MTFIIAELGVNHDGDMNKVVTLIDAAKEAGADAVKFQAFNSQRLWGDDRIKKYEISEHKWPMIAGYCDGRGVEFMCTPFGVPEAEFLRPLVKRWKVASGCLEKWDLLAAIADTKLPIIMSTGMAHSARISRALDSMGWPSSLTLLHCTSAYPAPIDELNLRAMQRLAAEFDREVGYSDHTTGITIPIAAASLGATVIEKHLTLDRSAEGPDHKASIEPHDFRVMVNAIRTVETALGVPEKRLQPSERQVSKAWYP